MLVRLLVAVKNSTERTRIRRLLAGIDVDVQVAPGKPWRWDSLLATSADMLVVTRSLLPDPMERSLAELQKLPDPPGVVVLLGDEDPSESARCQAAGVDAILYADAPDEILRESLASVIELRRELITSSVAAGRATARPTMADFVTSSPAMELFVRTVEQVRDSDASLLILGETGAGKERLARAIHGESRRADNPFISINCGALSESLIESELFGHESGAFTGATRMRRGCFEMAHRGTIFLDEIAEMPFHLQVKLLQVLQDLAIRPIGSERTIQVDVRVLAATNRDIRQEVSEGRFRRDLYYRLSVVTLEVPPLRDRVDDIPTLVESFADELSKRIGRPGHLVSPGAMDALCAYPWPGNVRELINVIERAVLLSDGPVISAQDLPDEIRGPGQGLPLSRIPADAGNKEAMNQWLDLPLKRVRKQAVEDCERAYLSGLLRQTRGRIGETAARAGIEPRSLYSKMKRYGLRKEDFKV